MQHQGYHARPPDSRHLRKAFISTPAARRIGPYCIVHATSQFEVVILRNSLRSHLGKVALPVNEAESVGLQTSMSRGWRGRKAKRSTPTLTT